MKLISASCTTQVLRDTINTTMEDRKVMPAAQAEMEDNMDEMLKRACWVDITKGMEMSKQVEYEHKLRGNPQLLNPSNPEVLNFADDQSVKTFTTQKTNGMKYTAQFLASLGDTAYMLADIDSQESDLFEQYKESSIKDSFNEIVEGRIITNLQYVTGLTPEDGKPQVCKDDNAANDKEANVVMLSPGHQQSHHFLQDPTGLVGRAT